MNDFVLFGEHPDAIKIRTVPCAVCGQTADLLDPEDIFNIVDEVHERCRDRNSDEPRDPDAGREDDLT